MTEQMPDWRALDIAILSGDEDAAQAILAAAAQPKKERATRKTATETAVAE